MKPDSSFTRYLPPKDDCAAWQIVLCMLGGLIVGAGAYLALGLTMYR